MLASLPSLYSQIVATLGSVYPQNSYLVMLTSISSGSIQVAGYAGIDSSLQDQSETYNSVAANVAQSSQISGYKVGTFSVAANGFTPVSPSATASTNSLIYIIIAGSILAAAILALLICLCLRWRRKRNSKKGKEEGEGEAETVGKVDTEHIEPATSKNMLKSEEILPKSSMQTGPRRS